MKHGLGNVGGLAVDVLYDLTGGTYDDAIHNIAQGVYAVREPKRLLSTRILRARERARRAASQPSLPGRWVDTPQTRTRMQAVSTKAGTSPT